MWAVMKAMGWKSLNLGPIEVESPKTGKGQPQRFIPVFELKEDALTFLDGKDEYLICEMKVIDEKL